VNPKLVFLSVSLFIITSYPLDDVLIPMATIQKQVEILSKSATQCSFKHDRRGLSEPLSNTLMTPFSCLSSAQHLIII
jgi:hypothetical protein